MTYKKRDPRYFAANGIPLPATAKEAKEQGLKHYFTGVPCKRGHLAVRRIGDLSCLACANEHSCRWYREYPDKTGQWKADNPERVREIARAWKRRNPDKVAAYNAKRRALKAGATVGDRKAYLEFVQWARWTPEISCSYCQSITLPGERELDHVIPLSRGGPDSVENLCVACPRCNARKNNRTAEEYFALLKAV